MRYFFIYSYKLSGEFFGLTSFRAEATTMLDNISADWGQRAVWSFVIIVTNLFDWTCAALA